MSSFEINVEDTIKLLHVILDNSLESAIVINKQGTILYCNPAACYLFGYQSGQLLNQNIIILIPDNHRVNFKSYLLAFCRKGTGKVIGKIKPAIGQRQDGTSFPLRIFLNEANLYEESVYIGYVQDLTQQQKDSGLQHGSNEALYKSRLAALNLLQDIRSEKQEIEKKMAELIALVEQKQVLVSAIEQSQMAVAVIDKNQCVEYANHSYCEVLGYPEQEIIGKKFNLTQDEVDNEEASREIWEQLKCGQPWCGKLLNKIQNGSYHWVSARIYPVKTLEGKVVNYISFCESLHNDSEAVVKPNQTITYNTKNLS